MLFLKHELVDWVIIVICDEGESTGLPVLLHDGALLNPAVFAKIIFQFVLPDVRIL